MARSTKHHHLELVIAVLLLVVVMGLTFNLFEIGSYKFKIDHSS